MDWPLSFYSLLKSLNFKKTPGGNFWKSVKKCGNVPKRFCPLVVALQFFSDKQVHKAHGKRSLERGWQKGWQRVGEWRRVGRGLAKGWQVALHPPMLRFPKRPFRRACSASSKPTRICTPKFVSRRGNTSNIGTNTPKIVPSPWGRLLFHRLEQSSGFPSRGCKC